jgi:glycosyltransferase involved in cell wall biosynthesis
VYIDPTEPTVAPDMLRDGYNIAYVPCVGTSVPQHFDEIWTPSHFSQDLISRRARVPVIRIPHPIDLTAPPAVTRSGLGLPENAFIFLSRCHPLRAVHAFRGLGSSTAVETLLVIDAVGKNADETESIRAACEGIPALVVSASVPEARQLIALCDCFVSLHGSTSFGLSVAHAMALAKPVIVTAHSGNMDYTSHDNSLLVKCELRSDGEYAEPDLHDATACMRRVLTDAGLRSEIARRGRDDVSRLFAAARIGDLMKRRIRVIGA